MSAANFRPTVTYGLKSVLLRILFSLVAIACTAHALFPQAPDADFVVDLGGSLVRFDTSGNPQPGSGQTGATFVPATGTVAGIAYGTDGNLYLSINQASVGGSNRVEVHDGVTGTVTSSSFVTDLNLGTLDTFRALTFGPDGNLYVVVAMSSSPQTIAINRYCGPTQAVCAPGHPLPAPSAGGAVYVPSQTGFSSVSKVTFGPDGNLYVSSSPGGTVLRFCGPLAQAPCSPGAAFPLPGQTGAVYASTGLILIGDLLFGPDGNLYILDAPGFFFAPEHIYRFCGPNLVCAGASLPPAGQPNGAAFINFGLVVLGADFGPDGNLYAADLQGGQILRFNGPNCAPAPCEGNPNPGPNGVLVGNVGGKLLRFPHRALITPPQANHELLLVSDTFTNKITRYDAVTGDPFPAPGLSGADFIVPGTTPGSANLSEPTGMIYGPDGDLYVSSFGQNEVLRFNGQTGAFMNIFVSAGAGGLNSPMGLTFGPDGDLYVSSWGNDSVLRFSGQTGAFVNSYLTPLLKRPVGLAFGLDGNLYVASSDADPTQLGTAAILRFDPQDPTQSDRFVSGITTPFGIAFGPDGNLYVELGEVDTNHNIQFASVQRFDSRTGQPLPSGADFVPNIGPVEPRSLAFGPRGKLYVLGATPGDSSSVVARYDVTTGAFVDAIVSGLNNPQFLTFNTAPATPVTGTVFHDSATPGNELGSIQVQAADISIAPGLLACPALLFACPTTTTDVAGQYIFAALSPPGDWLLTAWPPQALNYFPNSVKVTVPEGNLVPVTGNNIVVVPPTPIPEGTTISPSNLVPVTGGNVPVAGWNQVLTLSTTPGCNGAHVAYWLTLVPSPPSNPLPMTEGPAGTYTAPIGPFNPFKGSINVTISVPPCPGKGPQLFSFLLYIDPSGTIVDDVTGLPVAGATVTLFRSGAAKGTFTQVPSGSALMSLSNRNNPDLTNAVGAYGWDVVSGFYYVEASAPGYTCDPNSPPHGFSCVNGAVKSGVFAIPPAVTDLTLPLHRLVDTTPPVLSLPGNMNLTATSAGGAVASVTASADDALDGNVPVTCTPSSGSLFPLGTTTVNCSASDAHHNTATGSFTVTVGYNICPLYTVMAKKSGSTYPIKVQVCTASGTNLSSAAITLHATGVVMTTTSAPASLDSSGGANPDMDFRYDSTLAGYIFNLSLNGYGTGTYNLVYKAGSDPNSHTAQFEVK